MSRQPMLLLGIAVILAMSFLVGCGGSTPTPVSEAPPATSAPEQAAATPTAEPATSTPELPTETAVPPTATPVPPTPTPELPTATPTPAIVNPQPDTTFIGAMEVSQPGSEGTAEDGSLEFSITEDGKAIASMSITLTESKCSVTSEGVTSVVESESSTTSFEGPFPIAEGKIDATFNKNGKLKGQFTSPTEANGTINVVLTTVVGLGTLVNCDLGEWNWSAKVSTSASESTASVNESEASVTSNLSQGTALVLGGLEADVSSVEETATLPGLNLEAQSGMKFVVVKLKNFKESLMRKNLCLKQLQRNNIL